MANGSTTRRASIAAGNHLAIAAVFVLPRRIGTLTRADEATMLLLLLGAALMLIGIVHLAGPPIWRERLSGGKPRAVAGAGSSP